MREQLPLRGQHRQKHLQKLGVQLRALSVPSSCEILHLTNEVVSTGHTARRGLGRRGRGTAAGAPEGQRGALGHLLQALDPLRRASALAQLQLPLVKVDVVTVQQVHIAELQLAPSLRRWLCSGRGSGDDDDLAEQVAVDLVPLLRLRPPGCGIAALLVQLRAELKNAILVGASLALHVAEPRDASCGLPAAPGGGHGGLNAELVVVASLDLEVEHPTVFSRLHLRVRRAVRGCVLLDPRFRRQLPCAFSGRLRSAWSILGALLADSLRALPPLALGRRRPLPPAGAAGAEELSELRFLSRRQSGGIAGGSHLRSSRLAAGNGSGSVGAPSFGPPQCPDESEPRQGRLLAAGRAGGPGGPGKGGLRGRPRRSFRAVCRCRRVSCRLLLLPPLLRQGGGNGRHGLGLLQVLLLILIGQLPPNATKLLHDTLLLLETVGALCLVFLEVHALLLAEKKVAAHLTGLLHLGLRCRRLTLGLPLRPRLGRGRLRGHRGGGGVLGTAGLIPHRILLLAHLPGPPDLFHTLRQGENGAAVRHDRQKSVADPDPTIALVAALHMAIPLGDHVSVLVGFLFAPPVRQARAARLELPPVHQVPPPRDGGRRRRRFRCKRLLGGLHAIPALVAKLCQGLDFVAAITDLIGLILRLGWAFLLLHGQILLFLGFFLCLLPAEGDTPGCGGRLATPARGLLPVLGLLGLGNLCFALNLRLASVLPLGIRCRLLRRPPWHF
mmetsp:Transcript_75016/g.243830  ORF Transcript_75016/g.243830 Transcript_75016/m.243830 type:complete len:726 (+) Transcript_75016:1073-3250(+)